MAKAPVPGQVKTRLCPPSTLGEAAEIAEAALIDTLDAVAGCGAERRIVALDGQPGEWLPAGVEVIAQVGSGLSERLANAWAQAGGPGLQIGMDTPQVTAGLLDQCLGVLLSPGTDAVLGLADDGGWWSIGFREPWSAAFSDVPMSAPDTGRRQLGRLRQLGLAVGRLPRLRDVDSMSDALAVAAGVPGSRFAAAVGRVQEAVGRRG